MDNSLNDIRRSLNDISSFIKKHDKIMISLLLIVIALYAFWIRSFDLTGPHINADDPYLGYRIVDYAINNNLRLPTNDTFLNYPDGYNLYQGYFLWYYIPAVFGVLFSIFGVSNASLLAVKFYPPFFAALMAVAAYFIGKEVTNSRIAGLIAASFIAFTHAIVARTVSTSAIKEPLGGFFMLASGYFFIKSLKKFDWKYSTLSGAVLAISAYSWGGTNAYVFMLAGFALFAVIFNQFKKEFTHTYLITFGTYFVFGKFIQLMLGGGPFPSITQIYLLANIMASVYLLTLLVAKKYKLIPHRYDKYIGTYSVGAGFILFVLIAFIYTPLGDYAVTMISRLNAPLATNDIVASTVAYYRPSSLSEVSQQITGSTVFGWYNALLPIIGTFTLSIVGFFALIYFMFKRRNIGHNLFMMVWFVAWIGLGIGAVRMAYLSAIIAALFASFGLYYIGRFLYKQNIQYNNILYLRIVSIIVVAVILGVNFYSSYTLGKQIGPSMSPNWEDALLWLKNDSNEGDVVLSWWDYGYIIHWYAERNTYSDPGRTGGVDADKMIAKIFTSTNETEVIEKLKELNVRYVIHDASMVGKYSAVSTIASDGRYVDQFMTVPHGASRCMENGDNGTCNRVVVQYFNTDSTGKARDPQLWVIQENGNLRSVLVQNNQIGNISSVCTRDGDVITSSPGGLNGCVLPYANAAVLAGIRCSDAGCRLENLYETMFAQMWFFDAQKLEHFEKVYDNGEVKVFEVEYD